MQLHALRNLPGLASPLLFVSKPSDTNPEGDSSAPKQQTRQKLAIPTTTSRANPEAFVREPKRLDIAQKAQ